MLLFFRIQKLSWRYRIFTLKHLYCKFKVRKHAIIYNCMTTKKAARGLLNKLE